MFRGLGDPWRRRSAALLALGLAGLLAGLTFVATGTSSVVDNLIATGYVRTSTGTPVRGARVALYDARPTDTQSVESPLTTATTANDGSYSLALAPTAALDAEAAANGGYNNFYIAATAGTTRPFVAVTRQLVEGAWTNGDGDAVDGSVPSTRDDLQPTGDSAIRSGGAGGPNLYCGWDIRKKRIAGEQAPTVIGETHVVADMTEDFTYGTAADSNIEVATSYDGVNWSINGSFHVGNETGASIKWYVTPEDGHEWQSNFIYRKYKHWDVCGDVWWSVEPRLWTGGGAWPGADRSNLNHRCLSWYASTTQNYGPGQEFTRSSKKFTKFGFAVTVFGVTLGARSGASRYVVAHWTFGTAQQDHLLCGSNAQPSTAKRIFAGA